MKWCRWLWLMLRLNFESRLQVRVRVLWFIVTESQLRFWPFFSEMSRTDPDLPLVCKSAVDMNLQDIRLILHISVKLLTVSSFCFESLSSDCRRVPTRASPSVQSHHFIWSSLREEEAEQCIHHHHPSDLLHLFSAAWWRNLFHMNNSEWASATVTLMI